MINQILLAVLAIVIIAVLVMLGRFLTLTQSIEKRETVKQQPTQQEPPEEVEAED